MRKSFTLIELIVVIGIIAVLSALGVSSYNGFQKSARDTRRKNDLRTINNALNAFYAVNNRYPAAVGCAAGVVITTCSVNSTTGTSWISALVTGGFLEAVPQDPVNNAAVPWHATNNNYSYAYGGVNATGQEYDLTARLENPEDRDRCAVKSYKYSPARTDWCGSFSGQIYESSPNSL